MMKRIKTGSNKQFILSTVTTTIPKLDRIQLNYKLSSICYSSHRIASHRIHPSPGIRTNGQILFFTSNARPRAYLEALVAGPGEGKPCQNKASPSRVGTQQLLEGKLCLVLLLRTATWNGWREHSSKSERARELEECRFNLIQSVYLVVTLSKHTALLVFQASFLAEACKRML